MPEVLETIGLALASTGVAGVAVFIFSGLVIAGLGGLLLARDTVE